MRETELNLRNAYARNTMRAYFYHFVSPSFFLVGMVLGSELVKGLFNILFRNPLGTPKTS